MTTPTPAGNQPTENAAGRGLPVRFLTAWALLALAAAIVAFAFLRLIFPPFSHAFVDRFSVTSFVNTTVLVAPLLALLVATRIGPALRGARLMSAVALATYGAALLFGVLSFLVTLAGKFSDVGGRGGYAFGYLLQGLGDLLVELLLLALAALAALWTFKIFTSFGGKLPAVNVQTD
jgi:hypothetical protein